MTYRDEFLSAQARFDAVHRLHCEARRVDDAAVRRALCERAEQELKALNEIVQRWKTLLMYMLLRRAEQLYREMQALGKESRHE